MSIVLWSLRRVGAALLTLVGVSVLIFASVRLMPGDYTDLVLGPLATPEQRALVVAESGLDAPIVEQYLRWVSGVFTGDLGYSLVSKKRVRGGGVRYEAAGHRDDRTRHDRGDAACRHPSRLRSRPAFRGIGRRHREADQCAGHQPPRIPARGSCRLHRVDAGAGTVRRGVRTLRCRSRSLLLISRAPDRRPLHRMRGGRGQEHQGCGWR